MAANSQQTDPTQSDLNLDLSNKDGDRTSTQAEEADIPTGGVEAASTGQKPEVETPREFRRSLLMGLGCLVWLGIGIAFASLLSLQARTFIFTNKKWIFGAVVAIVLIAAGVAATGWFTDWVKKGTAQRRIGLIILGVTPLVMVAVTTVILLPVVFRAAALRMIFLLCVCLLPAMLYYLFIATKKNSILNEFILNLDRLGLLEPGGSYGAEGAWRENDDERKNRILTYLQRFEAAYGAIPTDLSNFVLKPTDLSQEIYKKGTSFSNILTAETTLPIILTTILIALGWLITLPPWYGAMPSRDAASPALDWLHIFTPVRSPVHFAFIGAYFFSLQMLFRRYVRRDLRPSAYVAVSLRIILAVIGTWIAVASMSSMIDRYDGAEVSLQATNQLLVLGFIIGVFPRVVWQIVGTVARKMGGFMFRLPSLQTALPITDLDGLTVWHESRLEEEDIENIPNMATADLIEMLLTTRIPPDRLIDWVDQAILYTHLGPEKSKNGGRREKLRAQGIRTASALIEGYARSVDREDDKTFEKILTDDAADRSPIVSLIDTMQTNPNLRLIQNWRGLREFKLPGRNGAQIAGDAGGASGSLASA